MATQRSSESENIAAVSTAYPAIEEKHAADVTPAAAAAAAADGTAIAKECIPGQKFRFPQKTIDWIMSQKRFVLDEDPDEYYNRMINDPDRHELYTQQFLEEERQLMRDMATLHQRTGDSLEKFQRWARYELETKGYVEVDEVYLDRRIRLQRFSKELYDAMMAVPGFIYKAQAEDLAKQVEKRLALQESNDSLRC
ncbi:hypothetical protein HU200_044020 [Digitaria exilis]|uniref:Uncharacterized protein n=1 Tax=Digitaria exilis TaxID=1010633 RepID=A0A835B3H4_9POAL|nr:hypothetical protein HU200_044020 [Digitaria exilis]CAB3492008.1 unnamed protein product [Digitaria exilis]